MTNIEFFRKAHRPLYYKAHLNKMRNGDTLSLGSIVARYPGTNNSSFNAYAQAYITKEAKGIYAFSGLWTIPTKSTRSDIWALGRFSMTKGVITLESCTSRDSLRAFFLVCRYIDRLLTAQLHYLKDSYADTWFYKNGIPFYFNGFTFDKDNTSLKGCRRLDEKTQQLTFSKLSFSDEFLASAICTPALKAMFEKADAIGAL